MSSVRQRVDPSVNSSVFVAEPGGAGAAGLQGGSGPAGASDSDAPTPPALPLSPPQGHVPDPGGRGRRVLQRLRRQHPPPSAGHGAGVPQETGRRRYNRSTSRDQGTTRQSENKTHVFNRLSLKVTNKK